MITYHAWYAVKAVDYTDHESLWSDFLSVWGYYEYSIGNPIVVSGIQHENITFDTKPNPFNHETTISFNLPHAGYVQLEVFNCSGRKIYSLLDAWCEAGEHHAKLRSEGLTSGIYLAKLQAGSVTQTSKLVLLK
jgi:hypothetical protein